MKEKRNKTGNVPNLRFKGFAEEWEVKKLGEVVKIYDGTHQTPNYVANGIPFYSVEHVTANQFENTRYISKDIFEKENERVKLEKGDILMTRIGSIGVAKYINWDVKASFYVSLALIKQSHRINNEYLFHYINSNFFQSELWKRTIHVAFPQKINLGEIGMCHLKHPLSDEQQKIASFLTLIDERIQTQSKIIQRLETLMQGLREKLFTQKLRFKDSNGKQFPDWKERVLSEVAEKRIKKNTDMSVKVVFTNSATLGIVNQRDFFDKDIANKNNISGYYIVNEDDFIYNPRISNEAPVGPISRNKIGKGVMSPLYTVFKFNAGNFDFIEQFYKTKVWHQHMKNISNYGARADRMSFSSNDFFEMQFPSPCLAEQSLISNFLSTIYKKIETEKKLLEHYKNQKKFLLQNLFI